MFTPDEIWEACLPRLRQYYGNTGDLETLSTFANATPLTVSGWLSGQRPTGERLLKLWHFLRAAGVRSPEFDRLDKYNLYLGELYAFSVVSMEQLYEILNVKQTGAVYDAIRGRTPMHPTFLLEDLRPEYDDQLSTAKQRVTKLRHLSAVSSGTPTTPTDHQSAPGRPSLSTEPQPARVTSPSPLADLTFAVEAANTLQSSLVILRFLDSDACPADLRATVLHLSGELSEFSKLTEGVLHRQAD